MAKRRCVVTGMGAITSLGNDIDKTWDGIVNSRSGVARIKLFDPETFPTQIAGEVKDFDERKYIYADNEYLDYMSRTVKYGIAAAKMAVESAKIDTTKVDSSKFGVSVGTGEEHAELQQFDTVFGAENVYNSFVTEKYLTERYSDVGEIWPIRRNGNMAAAHLAIMFNAKGPSNTSVTACASSGHAIGKALRYIESGDADIMLAGGCEGLISEFTVAGFGLLGALSVRNDEPERASRPFDRKRDGFILAEGGGMMVLEELEHAKARGANIIAELVGFGCSSNAYRITDTPPDGKGAVLSMRSALKDAGKTVEDIDYINAHGTSTLLNDKSETASIKTTFGEHASKTPVSSSKSLLGHMIAASGAVEAMISVLSMKHNLLPPTLNLENPDPDCDLDYVPNKVREAEVNVVLSNSFAFGGQNVSLILEKFKE